MSSPTFPTEPFNVFIIASHASPPPSSPPFPSFHTNHPLLPQVVYGYVGNKTASFVLQALGADVSALNTVHFSNHTGYRSFSGTRTSSSDLTSIYNGLRTNNLTSAFSMLLTGYSPSSSSVEAIGQIALDLKTSSTTRPGSFFWILDPVMGDNGALYVDPSVVPAYRSLLHHADLIVPNQFELEMLADVEVGSTGKDRDGGAGILQAIEKVHEKYRTPHVVVTSARLGEEKGLSVVGSTRTKEGRARAFRVKVDEFDCFFSGTGDLFASLMTVRLREQVEKVGGMEWGSWVSGDEVEAVELPLAKAVEKALASMHVVLEKTMRERDRVLEEVRELEEMGRPGVEVEDDARERHLLRTKAAEVRIVRNVGDLLYPKDLFKAEALDSRTLPQNRE